MGKSKKGEVGKMKIDTNKIRVTSTNYSNTGSNWNGVSVYHGSELIARVKTTAKHGSLNYIRKHPGSRYTAELKQQLRDATVPEWMIISIIT